MTQLSIHSFFTQLHLFTNYYIYIEIGCSTNIFSSFLFYINYWKLIHINIFRFYLFEIIWKMLIPAKKNLAMFSLGLEPRTFRVWGERDNHYTTKTRCVNEGIQNLCQLFQFFVLKGFLHKALKIIQSFPSISTKCIWFSFVPWLQ